MLSPNFELKSLAGMQIGQAKAAVQLTLSGRGPRWPARGELDAPQTGILLDVNLCTRNWLTARIGDRAAEFYPRGQHELPQTNLFFTRWDLNRARDECETWMLDLDRVSAGFDRKQNKLPTRVCLDLIPRRFCGEEQHPSAGDRLSARVDDLPPNSGAALQHEFQICSASAIGQLFQRPPRRHVAGLAHDQDEGKRRGQVLDREASALVGERRRLRQARPEAHFDRGFSHRPVLRVADDPAHGGARGFERESGSGLPAEIALFESPVTGRDRPQLPRRGDVPEPVDPLRIAADSFVWKLRWPH